MTTTESDNFYRVVSLLIDTGTDVLRRLFTKYATSSGATSVYQFICNEQAEIFKLQQQKKLQRYQVAQLLSPPSGPGDIINSWDICLLCVLLKNICPVSQIDKDSLEKLTSVRNSVYAHAGDAKLSEKDFDSYWNLLEGEIFSLLQGCADVDFEHSIRQSVSKIKSGPLSIDATVDVLKEWYAQDRSSSAQLREINEQLSDLATEIKGLSVKRKTGNPVLENLKQHSAALVDEFDRNSFVETEPFLGVKETLEKENVVVICGAASEGKSTLTLALTSLVGQGRCIFINHPSQIEHVTPNAADMIVIDNIFGQFCFDNGRFTEWKSRLDILQSSAKAGNVKVVITTRTEIWRKCHTEVSHFEIFNNLVELTSSKVSKENKEKLIEKYMLINGRTLADDSKIAEMVECYALPFGFPLCSNLFSTRTDVFQTQEFFFKLPYTFISRVLSSMEKKMYVALLFLFYKGNSCLDVDLKPATRLKILKSNTVLTASAGSNVFQQHEQGLCDSTEPNSNINLLYNVAKLVGINASIILLPHVRETFDELENIFVKHEKKEYTFINQTMYDCITFYHAETYLEEVIDNCSLEFLCRYADTKNDRSPNRLNIETDTYGTLTERIILEISKNSSTEHLIAIPALENENFCSFLCETLDESQQRLFHCGNEDESTRKGFLKAFVEHKSDLSCKNLVTQFLMKVKDMSDQAWYSAVKEDIKIMLYKKGYNMTIESLCNAGVLPKENH